ncbi:MAG: sodium-dependent transporter [Xanthobacteraceae bacterium]|nr:sodium-dependent transporter [Xanthobacteraceae bacterium]
MTATRDRWSGRSGFVLANVAAAVGLGSIWKFPYEVGTNGGGSFVICYVAGLILIVLPLMLCELAIGRHGRSDAIKSVAAVAEGAHASRWWASFALLGVVTGILILSFYSVIGGWALAHVVETMMYGLPPQDAAEAKARFDAFLSSPTTLLLYHLAFMAMAVAIVARGVSKGIERACMILMPTLIALMVVLAVYSLARGGFWPTLHYLFAFDLSKITPKVALEALGLGFFSIGVGLSIMIAYAGYADRTINLKQVAILTLVSDTAVSFLAAFAIFPIVFAESLDPSSGPGLVFVTLPLAFSHMPFGTAAAIVFFALLLVAAIGSAISFLELATAPLQHALRCSRSCASIICGTICWALGIVTVLSFNRWAEWFPLASVPGFARSTWFDLIDHLTSNVLLPIGGFGIAVFVGWAVPRRMIAEELGLGKASLKALYVVLRYIVPAGIATASLAVFL